MLDKLYDPKPVEEKWLKTWLGSSWFHADPAPGKKKPFVIVIPPPNITGALHMGHALNNTLQDVLIRWRRMQGFNALWMPGTDHAGIATQAVVEKRIRDEEKKIATEKARIEEDMGHARRSLTEYKRLDAELVTSKELYNSYLKKHSETRATSASGKMSGS